MIHLEMLDYLTLAGYFLLTAAIGISVSRRKTNSEDLFLAGRSLGPLAVGFSLFASNISSDTLVGLPGAAYRNGISAANYEWMAGVVLIFAVFAVLPVLMKARISTMPEWMERRFDPRLRRYLSAVTLFLSIALDTAGSLYAGALITTTFIPGTSMVEVCYIIAIFAGIYTASGGLRAVVYTDFMQAIVLLVGSAALAWFVFGHFDHSWSRVLEQVDASKLSLIRPLGDPGVPWLGLLTGLPIVGFYYWTMNQYVIQRVLGARDLESAGRASLLAAALKLLPLFLMTMPGALATVLLPDLDKPDQVFPQMVAKFTPPGLTGLMLAGVIAALMSSVSSTLNSAATLITLDFVQPRRPHWDGEKLAWCGRVVTVVVTLIAATWAPMIEHFQGLWAYMQQLFAFVASPLVAVFLWGLWSKRLGASAALRGLICGHLFSVLYIVAQSLGWVHIHYTVIGGVVCAFTALAIWGWMRWLGRRDQPDDDDQRLVMIARHGFEAIGLDVKIGAGVIVLLVIALLISFH